MSLTKPVNSKSNIKQYSNADLPVNPRQPAMARYAAESTAGQTVINLPFQVDTVNAADSFILTVDGKLLTPGALNDYQLTAVDGFGFSSTVTMNYALAAGLNIQGIKLGLKKEAELLQDARFTALYDGTDEGFQPFVVSSTRMSATNTVGTPGAGQFYSTIVNRASLADMRTDLGTRMGIDRIHTKTLIFNSNESGPASEAVYNITNDERVRLVGSSWGINSTIAGLLLGSANITDYAEITFYGTGLNFMTHYDGNNRDVRVSVDGGSEGSNVYIQSANGLLNNRGYTMNCVSTAVSGLALGVHTVKLRGNTVQGLLLAGVEILNEASTLKVNPGTAYRRGLKLTTAAQQSPAHNSSFESGTLGTRGGRVLVYQKSDGTIAKAVQPANAASAFLAAADHTNEEVVRQYHWREFGAFRTDDFSTVVATGGSGTDRAFTLEDGSTTLSGNAVRILTGNEALGADANTNYYQFTFVGTGLDIIRIDGASGGNVDSHTVLVDGVSAGSIADAALNTKRTQKIVSGLPYGTHTVRITRGVTSSGTGLGIASLIVYQPKKPTLPAGAVELADYNLMANYVADSTGSQTSVSIGVLQKPSNREAVYVGTWTAIAVVPSDLSGQTARTTTNGATVSYTFWGTGIEINARGGSGNVTGTVQIDGVNYTGAATALNGTSWTAGTSTWVAGSANNTSLQISGLALGVHTVRLTTTVSANTWNVNGFSVITPLHSQKSDLPTEANNTFPIGSTAISDNRKYSPVKDTAAQVKAVAQAFGVTSNPTTTSTVFIPVPELSVALKTNGGRVEINYSLYSQQSAASQTNSFIIYVDGVPVTGQKIFQAYANGAVGSVSDSVIVSLPAGVHKFELYWAVGGGTATLLGTNNRNISVKEL